MITSQYDYLMRIVLIGDTGVGKTSLFDTFINNKTKNDYFPTIGVDFGFKIMEISDKLVKCQIWDTAGMERFRTITHNYFRGADIIILFYDITSQESFNNLEYWYNSIKQNTDSEKPYTISVIGTKKDLSSKCEVLLTDVDNFCKSRFMEYYETSSFNYNDISNIFTDIIKKTIPLKKDIEDYNSRIDALHVSKEHSEKSCCILM